MYSLIVIAATFLSSTGHSLATNSIQRNSYSLREISGIDHLNQRLKNKQRRDDNKFFASTSRLASSFYTQHRRLTPMNQASLSLGTTPALSGTRLVLAVIALASSAICIPHVPIRSLFCVNNIGCSLSISTMGALMRDCRDVVMSNAVDFASISTILFGFRAVYLSIRDATRGELHQQIQNNTSDEQSTQNRRTFHSLAYGILQVFLTAPLLYLVRDPTIVIGFRGRSIASKFATFGLLVAWRGTMFEAIANAQMFLLNRKQRQHDKAATATVTTSSFVGPTNFVYKMTRYPNYTGEMLFWIGVYIAGIPSIIRTIPSIPSMVGLACSTSGLVGRISILSKATKVLELQREQTYGGQPLYEEWKQQVKATLIPFIK